MYTWFNFFIFFGYFKAFKLTFMYLYLGVCAMNGAYVEASGQPAGVSILFAAWGPRTQTQVVRLCHQCFYPL